MSRVLRLDEQFIESLDYMTPYCPAWVEKIKNNNLDFQVNQSIPNITPYCDLESYEYCICGEAHNNRADYSKCDVCYDYAKELMRSARVYDNAINYDDHYEVTEEFKYVFINFTEHWKNHVELFKENIRLQNLALEETN